MLLARSSSPERQLLVSLEEGEKSEKDGTNLKFKDFQKLLALRTGGSCPHFSPLVKLAPRKLTAPFSLASLWLFKPIKDKNRLLVSSYSSLKPVAVSPVQMSASPCKKLRFVRQIWGMGLTARIGDGCDLGVQELNWGKAQTSLTPAFGSFCQVQPVILAKRKGFVEKGYTYCTVVVAKRAVICLCSNSAFSQS